MNRRYKISTLNSIYEVRVTRDPVIDVEKTEFRCLTTKPGGYGERLVGDYWYQVKPVYIERRERDNNWWPIEVIPLDEEKNWPFTSRYLRTSTVESVEELDA